jgi:predicted dehydrogenase
VTAPDKQDDGPVGIAVIGCGSMGMGIVRRVLALEPRLRVKALYDPDPRSIDAARDELRPRPQVFESCDRALQADGVDWAMIASWNCHHAGQTVAAFEAGKHVFCQKPLATTWPDCLAMRRAQEASGKLFNLGFTLRYSPHYRRLRELLDQGVIGRLVSMECNETLDFNHGGYIMGDWRRLRANAGSHLLEKCCHDMDLANWMTGSRPRRVASFGGLDFFRPENAGIAERLGRDAEGRTAYRTWGGRVGLDPFTADKDIVDNQVAILEYENGVRATFHTNCNAGLPERRMYLLGTEGAIRADVLTGRIEYKRIGFDTPLEDASTSAKGGHGNGDEVLAQELAASMTKGIPPTVGLPEGLVSSATCFALDEAETTGQTVDLAPWWRSLDAGAGEQGAWRPAVQ